MFAHACRQIRPSLYAICGLTNNDYSFGTAFMIAPAILATAAHITHKDNQRTHPMHQCLMVSCALDDAASNTPETAFQVAEDPANDIALLSIRNPRHTDSVTLDPTILPLGSACGTFGFPTSLIKRRPDGRLVFEVIERFRSAYISSYHPDAIPGFPQTTVYEVDCPMYPGSSGSPGFRDNGLVIAIASRSQFNFSQELPSYSGSKHRHKPQTNKLPNPTDPMNRIPLSIATWVPSTYIINLLNQIQAST